MVWHALLTMTQIPPLLHGLIGELTMIRKARYQARAHSDQDMRSRTPSARPLPVIGFKLGASLR